MSAMMCSVALRGRFVAAAASRPLRAFSSKAAQTIRPRRLLPVTGGLTWSRQHSVRTTEALVARKANTPLSLESVKLDALRPDEAFVEIHATGICHTDLSMMNGTLPVQFPFVFGHEGAGVVLEVGEQVKHVKKGDKVLLSMTNCGDCKQCHEGHPSYCDNMAPRNISGGRSDGSKTIWLEDGAECQGNFFGQSSFARHSLVSGTAMTKIPDDADLALYAPLGCGFSTGAGTVINVLKVTPGSSLAVFGAGAVGFAAIMAGKFLGATTIIAVDVNPDRLVLAKELGATHVIDGRDTDIVEQIKKIHPPLGVNFAVDASGVPKVIETMVASLAKLGKAASVGAPSPDKTVAINIWEQLVNGREYVGSCMGDGVPGVLLPHLIDQQKQGKFPIERLVKFYDAKDYQTAIEDMHSGKVVKPVLKWV